jgi:hypothetical protein
MIVYKSRLERDLSTIPYILAVPLSSTGLYQVLYRGHNLRFAYQRFLELGGEILTRLEGKVIDKFGLAILNAEYKYVVVHSYGNRVYNKIYAGDDRGEAYKEFKEDETYRILFKNGKEIRNALL